MVLHNPNNWHWVNKDTSAWARNYLDKELDGVTAEENGVTAQIDKILSMDGDVDVSQRKGKVITLFDVKLQLEYSGTWTVEPYSRIYTHLEPQQARLRMMKLSAAQSLYLKLHMIPRRMSSLYVLAYLPCPACNMLTCLDLV